MLHQFFIEPFLNNHDLRRALVACIAISCGSAPFGVFLVMRRMSLAADTLSHGIFPGVAIAFVIAGKSFWALTLGGILAGFLVTIINTVVKRSTKLREDASFAGAYIISLAAGVLIITANGGDEELVHMLFGDIAEISNKLLFFATAMGSISLIGLAVIYRPLIVESVDPVFMRAVSGRGGFYHQLFMILLVLNLVSAFQALGTLMAVGLVVLPAICARFWTNNIDTTIITSIGIGLVSSIGGLLIAYHNHLSIGSSVVVTGGVIYFLSIIFGRTDGVIIKLLPHRHLAE